MYFILMLLVGAVTGLLLGLVGGGGSILTVPALVILLDMNATVATTTALVVVGFNAAYGAFRQSRSQPELLQIRCALVLGLVGLIGTQVGNWLNHKLSEQFLLTGFAILMLIIALLMLRPIKLDQNHEQLACLRRGQNWADRTKILGAGFGLGFLTGLFGVGGGFLIVPALVLLLGFAIKTAGATSLLIITLNSLAALAGRYPWSGLDWALALILLGMGIAGTHIGGRLAARLEAKTLRKVFAWLVIGLGSYMLYRSLYLL